jgi:hypothetical protein
MAKWTMHSWFWCNENCMLAGAIPRPTKCVCQTCGGVLHGSLLTVAYALSRHELENPRARLRVVARTELPRVPVLVEAR